MRTAILDPERVPNGYNIVLVLVGIVVVVIRFSMY